MATNKRKSTPARKKAMLAALERSLGVVTTAARAVGIDRGSHYKWVREDPKYAEAVRELKLVAHDFAKTQMFKLIEQRNPRIVEFYMSTQVPGFRKNELPPLEAEQPAREDPAQVQAELDAFDAANSDDD